MKNLIETSHIELNPDAKSPSILADRKELYSIKSNNNNIIEAFVNSCGSLVSKLKDDVVIMLTDKNATLISTIASKNTTSKLMRLGICEGTSFLEESIGCNAISVSMKSKRSIFLTPEEHSLNIFNNWHSFATPIIYENEIIAYLDVSTLNTSMKNEIKIIAELLPYKITINMQNSHKLDKLSETSLKIKISTRQHQIMNMIVTGLTEKQISQKLFIALPTVKYHKSKIFEKMDVKNTTQFIKKYFEIENQIYIQ